MYQTKTDRPTLIKQVSAVLPPPLNLTVSAGSYDDRLEAFWDDGHYHVATTGVATPTTHKKFDTPEEAAGEFLAQRDALGLGLGRPF